ncbi:hypothetical protein [Streptomyces kasugaensis]|uniref:hypothetical protein n=1 Tax=Streptomyces kasugaensis TaxID=1946 RepID=UPI0013EF7813|nr:hypothetical protein [Streptomyces kasugaensis]
MGRYGAAALLLGYSAERVAELLGLHVGIVRTFVRGDTTAELLKIIRTLTEERRPRG